MFRVWWMWAGVQVMMGMTCALMVVVMVLDGDGERQ